jgi:hypothetical protein
LPARAHDRQRDGGDRRDQCGQTDSGEVNAAAELNLLARQKMQRREWKGSKRSAEGKEGHYLLRGPPQHAYR